MNENIPVLTVNGLHKQYGEGCPACTDGQTDLVKTFVRTVALFMRVATFLLNYTKGSTRIVGESGSGKSTLMQLLYFDQEATRGDVRIRDYENGKTNVLTVSAQQKRYIRNHVLGMVYQNPLRGLRMDFSSISNIAEKLIAAGNRGVGQMVGRGEELLKKVNIPVYRMFDQPKNFSGGMQQRVQIAKALSNNPPILLLDEVTTGLDLSVQANVLDLIRALKRELYISMIVVSHDLAVIRMLADRTFVILDGQVVEQGLTDQILEDPQHQYTQELVHSLL